MPVSTRCASPVPTSGAVRTCSCVAPNTPVTASTMMPTTVPPLRSSIHFVRLELSAGMSKYKRKSTTGMTIPRCSATPTTARGIWGKTVTGNGLKDPDSALLGMPHIKPIAVDPVAVASALELA